MKVSLNGKEAGTLTADSFMAFYLLPGEYKILYLVYDENGEKKDSFSFPGALEAETQ